jgi:hypothetical protein
VLVFGFSACAVFGLSGDEDRYYRMANGSQDGALYCPVLYSALQVRSARMAQRAWVR